MGSNHWQRQVIGNMMGTLFIRTYERGERVYQAMLSRGYQGLPLTGEIPKGGQRDILALSLTTVFALLGQTVYLLR